MYVYFEPWPISVFIAGKNYTFASEGSFTFQTNGSKLSVLKPVETMLFISNDLIGDVA